VNDVSQGENELIDTKFRRALVAISVLTILFGSQGLLLSPNILAANGAFVPPYSDYGHDTQGDTYFDHLVLNVSVDVTEAGTFNIYGGLFDSGFSELITEENSLQNLPVGNTIVPMMFSGADIYSSGLDGPYGVWLTLYDDKWQVLESDSATTSGYNHTDFQHLLAEFSPPHQDLGVDANEDLLYDHLMSKINITVEIPGIYKVEADLFDASQSKWITDGTRQSYYPKGNHSIELTLLGCRIRKSGIDGPYKLQLKLKKDGSHLVSEDTHDTATYFHTDFDGFSAYFTGASSDTLNPDNDLLYDYLRVSVEMEVNESGIYKVEADLFDATFHLNYIASTANVTYLVEGSDVLDLYFAGHRIYSAMSDDRYVADLVLLDNAGFSMVKYSHTTAQYNHNEFEQEVPAVLSPPHEEHGSDQDADGYYDSLILEVSVESMTDLACNLRAKMHDLGRSTLISDREKNIDVVEGLNVISMSFGGDDIFSSGIDGPFEIGIYLYDAYDNLLDKGIHITQFFISDEFRASTQTPIKGDISGTLVDQDGDPIPGARVELYDEEMKVGETHSNQTGDFRFLDLDDGTYTLVFNKPGHPTITKELLISGGSSVQIPSLTMEDINDDGSDEPVPWTIILIALSVVLVVTGSLVMMVRKRRKSE
jgi:hypothetical protein